MARLDVEGLNELIDKVNRLGEQGSEIKKRTLNRAGELIKSSMEKKAPRSKKDKSHMANYISVSEITHQKNVDYIEIGPSRGDNSEFYYSKFSEYGTSKQPAQHWASNSLLENTKKINEAIYEELKKELDNLG